GNDSKLTRTNWNELKKLQQLDNEQEVQIGDSIGAGAWGVVHLSTLSSNGDSSSSPFVVAVKIASNMAGAKRILEKEAEILSYINSQTTSQDGSLAHPYVVQFLGYDRQRHFTIMEYIPLTLDYLMKTYSKNNAGSVRFDEPILGQKLWLDISAKLVDALAFIHQ